MNKLRGLSPSMLMELERKGYVQLEFQGKVFRPFNEADCDNCTVIWTAEGLLALATILR